MSDTDTRHPRHGYAPYKASRVRWRDHAQVTLRIGTSGYQYRHWRERFYPPGLPTSRWLAYYAEHFASVELNATFYRLPEATAFTNWARAVPDGFTFAVKASRYLTHIRRLRDPREPVERLMDRASRLGDRLGPILLQLPPDMPIALDRLAETLDAFPSHVRVAVEPRHRSWFVRELKTLLEERRAALCVADRRSQHDPVWRTTAWAYVRLHEGRATPRPCYGRAALRGWALRLRDGWGNRPDAYVYFNNDGGGCAVRDAAILERICDRMDMPTSRAPGESFPRNGYIGPAPST
jgi:uncharacterized protein YecE (DUF72 family)